MHDGEVAAEQIVEGDLEIRTVEDLDNAQGIRLVTGDLRVLDPEFTVLSLPNIEVVGGRLWLGGDLDEIDLPALETVGGHVVHTFAMAERFRMPRLETVGEGLEASADSIDLQCLISVSELQLRVGTSTALDLSQLRRAESISISPGLVTDLRLDRLASGRVSVGSMGGPCALSEIRLPALVDPAELALFNCPSLATIEMGPGTHAIGYIGLHAIPVVSLDAFAGVTHLDALGVSQMPNLTSVAGLDQVTGEVISLAFLNNPQLADIGSLSDIQVTGSIHIEENDSLTSISFPDALALAEYLTVRFNDALVDLTLPALVEIGQDSFIVDNPLLPTCQADAIAERVTGAAIWVSGNGADVCL